MTHKIHSYNNTLVDPRQTGCPTQVTQQPISAKETWQCWTHGILGTAPPGIYVKIWSTTVTGIKYRAALYWNLALKVPH